MERIFPGDSELARRMRALDWSKTAAGDPSTWPENLRTALRICLTSRFPMHVWWGPELTLFYNDAYISFLGRNKHPAVLGRSGFEAWAEIWSTIGPMIESVRSTGVASWSEDIAMVFDRHVPREEVYVTFSFSPILGADGTVDGLFCACTETTEKLIGSRRIETLRKLGIRAAQAGTAEEACRESASVLAQNPFDLPFAAIYLRDAARKCAVLAATAHLSKGHPLPLTVPLEAPDGGRWPLASVLRTPVEVTGLELEGLPGGAWPEPAHTALVLPITGAAHEMLSGWLVAGVSPRRVLDGQYRSFFDLVAGQLATAIADAQAYETDRRRAEALAELDRAKTAFFTNLSHEFRTPLTLILAPLEEAIPRVGPEVRPLLETTHRNAVRLLRLVNALLDFSRIEAGRTQASYQPVDLAAFTAELASLFRSAIERAGLAFVVDCRAIGRPTWVDPDLWEKIVLNLLSNALKFTFQGEIRVATALEGEQAVLTVSDTGTGVAPDQVPHLFERFHRIEGAEARTHEGSGLGLAMVHELVRMHGGTIEAESRLGEGTRFRITLPLGNGHLPAERFAAAAGGVRQSSAAAYVAEAERWFSPGGGRLSRPAPARSATAEEPPGARLLVVDDNADMREYLTRLLATRWAVEAVADGAAALEALRAQRFDLVLADVMMPKLDGLGLLRAIRTDPSLMPTPIILLSARAAEDSRIDGLAAGADDYLIKPFSSREVLARVEAHLKLSVRRQAVEANRLKDEFIAMLGHELRNPLAPILTAVEAIERFSEAPPLKELAVIERSARQMARLVDDLMDVSRITRGKVTLTLGATTVEAVVRRAVEMVTPLLEQKRQRLELRVPPVALHLHADEGRLGQVVANLLDNAVKFTPEGGHVAVEAARDGERIRITVSDDGCGVPADLLPHVFELFTQAPQGVDRRAGGLGLGLPIARRMVELHGGTIEAESTGRGSTFTVWLPASPAPHAAKRRTMPAMPQAAHPRRLLLVDDNEDLLKPLRRLLEAAGHKVVVARDGAEALAVAGGFHPEVAIVDLGLPLMDGYQVAEKLSSEVALIALTGYGQPSDVERSRRAGFCVHLTKPVDFRELLSAIDHCIESC
jgi:signal transduction histidine kinase